MRDDSPEAQVEPQIDKALGRREILREAVNDAPEASALHLFERVDNVVLGLAAVDDDRQVNFESESDLRAERLDLRLTGSQVVVIIQPDLPDGHKPVHGLAGWTMGGDQPPQHRLRLGSPLLGVMGVDPGSREEAGIRQRLLHRTLTARHGVADADHCIHATCHGPIENLREIAGELAMGEVGMRVDDHRDPVYRTAGSVSTGTCPRAGPAKSVVDSGGVKLVHSAPCWTP